MSLIYRTADEPDRDGTELLRHVLEAHLGPVDLRLPVDAGHPDSRLELIEVGAVRAMGTSVGCHDLGPCVLVRGSRHIARTSGPPPYRIDVPVQGRLTIAQDGRQAPIRPGELAVTDLTRPAGWAITAEEFITLLLPRALLPLRPEEVAVLTASPIGGELGGVVAALARQLLRIDPARAADGARLSTAVLDVAAVAMATRLGSEQIAGRQTSQRALLTRVYAFIEERLGDPDLTPGGIAAAHHVSPRYLYRLFEPDGYTPSGWIRRRRLEQAHKDLLDPRMHARTIASIGSRWGFTNSSSFIRAFKAEFGFTPGELRCERDGVRRG